MSRLSRFAKRRAKALLNTLLVAFISALIYAIVQSAGGLAGIEQAAQLPAGSYRVIDTADGDTIYVSMDGVRESVRLVGVDTPETHHPSKPAQCYGAEASRYTKTLTLGQTVRLRADSQQPNRDKYGRLLRYVELADGRELNRLLVSDGYGFVTRQFATDAQADLIRLEAAAEQAKTGLWAACAIDRSGDYPQTGPANP